MERTTNYAALLFCMAVLLLSASFSVHAQANDSVPQGVIKVRRAPVPSDYHVEISYAYKQERGYLSHLFGKRTKEYVAYSPPEPLLMDDHDSSRTLLDSSFMITFYGRMGKPGVFPWEEWLNHYRHDFEWDDTAGVDSATFVFDLNSKGRAVCTALPVAPGDSSAMRMQKNLTPYMRRLWLWYPATATNDGKRQHKVGCTVTVKVYAVKVGYGRNLPLKIVD